MSLEAGMISVLGIFVLGLLFELLLTFMSAFTADCPSAASGVAGAFLGIDTGVSLCGVCITKYL